MPSDIQDHPDWVEGDFSLISSNGWRFKIHTWSLCWSSGVFRSASEVCDSTRTKEIVFTDKQIETSSVLDVYFDIVSHTAVPSISTLEACDSMRNVIRFLRKYECDGPLQFVKTEYTNHLLMRKIPPLYVLFMATAMDDMTWAKTAYQYRYPVLKKADTEVPFVLLSHLSLTPGNGESEGLWPMEFWNRIQPPYAWPAAAAWTSAWGSGLRNEGKSLSSQTHPKKIVDVFESFMSKVQPNAAGATEPGR